MPAITDGFDVAVTSGWGALWTTLNGVAADYSISGGFGHIKTTTTDHIVTVDTGSTDHEALVLLETNGTPVGASLRHGLCLRVVDTSTYYRVTVAFFTTGQVAAELHKRVGGTLTAIDSLTTALTNTVNIWVRARVTGSRVKMRVWQAGTAEPAAWTFDVEDTEVPLSTRCGPYARWETGGTAPTQADFDSFTATPVEITAVEQDSYPPRVLVSVTGLEIGDKVELFRVVGGEQTALRAGEDDAVSDTSFLRTDAEMPFGVPVTYLALVNELNGYSTVPTTYTLPGGKVAVTDAINGNSAEVVILAWPEKTHQRQSTLFKVGGRNVIVAGDMGMFEGNIELFVESTSARDNLESVLREATEGVVQIRQPGGYDGVDSYLAVLGMTERRHSQDGSDQRRVFAINVAEVEGWAPLLEAMGYTLQDIADAHADLLLLDLYHEYPTLLDLAQGDFSA